MTGRGVEELRQSCELQALSEGARLTLDLSDVSFADGDGIDLLKDLISREVAIVHLAPFLALQLREGSGGIN